MPVEERLQASSSELSRDDLSSNGRDGVGDVEKAFLLAEDTAEETKNPPNVHILRRPTTWLTLANICVFLASCTAWYQAPTKPAVSVQDHWKATSFYSPILERFDIPRITRTTNGTLYDTNPPSILRQRVGREADDEWHRIGDHVWPLIITADDVRKLGKDPGVAVKVPEALGYGADAYLAQTEVFHHLHCLDMIRRELSYEHYYEHTEGPKPGGAQHRAHVGHCFDVLAQALKCTSSADMITFNWVDKWEQPFPDFMNRKVCRDFDALLGWVNGNAMDPRVFRQMKTPPPGWPVMPEPGPARST
ncbi:hypothetical protein Cob_v007661 [Colletotrichum orbiculare MAFF 240422]|uniref:Cyclochlorotine biosynthesis protein O n=1 Tax=Colletotrichum orbiculare (strain 104-T / ATCC 96160 / CBS 514.97 / LARS 414 / MAFF 240422) TaxID=1213857 RepID=N4VJE9_COLOR|nr:hypothetical protein Cob_v007661 [Colletotrichum orbiculare MAFF 240422]